MPHQFAKLLISNSASFWVRFFIISRSFFPLNFFYFPLQHRFCAAKWKQSRAQIYTWNQNANLYKPTEWYGLPPFFHPHSFTHTLFPFPTWPQQTPHPTANFRLYRPYTFKLIIPMPWRCIYSIQHHHTELNPKTYFLFCLTKSVATMSSEQSDPLQFQRVPFEPHTGDYAILGMFLWRYIRLFEGL